MPKGSVKGDGEVGKTKEKYRKGANQRKVKKLSEIKKKKEDPPFFKDIMKGTNLLGADPVVGGQIGKNA